MRDPLNFKTTDQQLALALVTAGCRFAPQPDGPAINCYTPDDMRSKGLLPPGSVSIEEFEKAAAKAHSARKKGIVTYLIMKDEVFENAIKAWDAMVDEMQSAKDDNRAPNLPMIGEKTAMQVAYIMRLNARAIKDIPFFNTPILSTMKGDSHTVPLPNRTAGVKEVHAPSGKTVTEASGQIWSLGLSREKKKAIGL